MINYVGGGVKKAAVDSWILDVTDSENVLAVGPTLIQRVKEGAPSPLQALPTAGQSGDETPRQNGIRIITASPVSSMCFQYKRIHSPKHI